jgi:hypothetical protein
VGGWGRGQDGWGRGERLWWESDEKGAADAQALLNPRQEAGAGDSVASATPPPPQHANTWREQVTILHANYSTSGLYYQWLLCITYWNSCALS